MRDRQLWSTVALAATIVILLAVLAIPSRGATCQVCRNPVVKQLAVQQHLAAVAPVYYQVAPYLQQEAAATQQLRQSDEYIELQQLRGFRAGVEAAARVHGSPAPVTPAAPAAKEAPAALEPEPGQPAASAFADRYPTIAANCTRCHTGDDPKGALWLDGTVTLEGPDAATRREAIARAVINDQMPDGRPLDHQTKYNLLTELLLE